MRWLVVVLRLPTEPSRHRVAVWRELRKVGALSLGQGVWAVPELPAFEAGLRRALELTDRAGGQRLILRASGRSDEDAERFRALFCAARAAEWREFLDECDKYEAEIAKEIRIEKLTLAELDEEEQSLERLRRWHRELVVRDLFGTPEASEAGERLKQCADACDDYAERVFRAVHEPPGPPR